MSKNVSQDLELINSILSNQDSKYIEIMYNRMFDKIRNLVFKGNGNLEDAKDLLHDTVLLFFKSVKEGKYKLDHDVDAYVYTIAKNRWITKAERDKKIIHTEKTIEIQTNDVTTLNQIYSKERVDIIQSALDKIGERCRQLLQLIYFEDKNSQEIMQSMGYTSANVVKSKHYKCKHAMMEIIQQNHNYTEIINNN